MSVRMPGLGGRSDRAIAGTCPAGESIRVVNQNGTVTCEVDFEPR